MKLLLHNSQVLLFDVCFIFMNNLYVILHETRTLDVGGSNVTFGGLRTVEFILQHPAQIKTHDFVGCIRNIHVNGFLLRAAMALATYNILDK